MKKITKISVALPFLGLIFLSNGALPVSAQILPVSLTRQAQVTISASLGEPLLKLWGYGAPNSRIELTGNGVFEFTYTSSAGYFEFAKAYLPSPSLDLFYPELCLTEIDALGRATPPTCIPALPATNLSYDIGPVILPPTISLDASNASGMTIPDSDVKIVLAEGEGAVGSIEFDIVRTAKAYYIPNYTIRSDSRGYFSFNVPNTTPANWRVFAITNYAEGATSPKSNTLTFSIVSPFLTTILSIWKFILSLLTLPIFIILEIVLILLVLAVIFLRKNKRKKVYLNSSVPVRQYQSYLKSKRMI
jgi:hypothetical protein